MTIAPPNGPDAILRDLASLGVTCVRDGDDLVLRPKGKVPALMIEVIRTHKAELLARLGVSGRDHASRPPDRPADVLAALLVGIEDAEVRAGLQYAFDERAGIVEYDAGASREEAERVALASMKT